VSGSLNQGKHLDAAWLTDKDNFETMKNHLAQYFRGSIGGGANFSGRFFEVFVGMSAPERFTAFDVLAAESLSVNVPRDVAHWLVRPDPDRDDLLWECLRNFSDGITLWDCAPELLAVDGHLSRLYLKLKDQRGLGKVTTSKLLATKFPNVVPIRDSLVEQVLGWADQSAWWMPMRNLTLSGVHEVVSNLPLPDGAPAVTTLRKLDVVLWMEARSRGFKA
jgi:hypothetical protein